MSVCLSVCNGVAGLTKICMWWCSFLTGSDIGGGGQIFYRGARNGSPKMLGIKHFYPWWAATFCLGGGEGRLGLPFSNLEALGESLVVRGKFFPNRTT